METVAESAVGTPHMSLTRYVRRYSGYRYLGFAPGIHRGLPSGGLTFIVSIGPAIDVAVQTDPTQAPRSYRAVLSGLQATTAMISHCGDQEGVTIQLTPDGCRALFGMPAGGLWDTTLELNEMVGRTGDELWERLQYATTWDERFAACDEVLRRLVVDNPLSAELRRAWQLIVTSGGTVGVAELAGEVGWSRQHLGRRFASEFGCSPKLAARVVRFDRARHLLQTRPRHVTAAEVAAACGYYDQAHFTNEFTALAGCTPRRWMIEEGFPFFQDGGDAAG